MRICKRVTMGELGYELSRIPSNLSESSNQALMLTRVLELAKTYCPVLTGALRETIRVERPSQEVSKLVAGNPSVDYARYVHDGTPDMAPRPFLLQALIDDRIGISLDILNGALSRL